MTAGPAAASPAVLTHTAIFADSGRSGSGTARAAAAPEARVADRTVGAALVPVVEAVAVDDGGPRAAAPVPRLALELAALVGRVGAASAGERAIRRLGGRQVEGAGYEGADGHGTRWHRLHEDWR